MTKRYKSIQLFFCHVIVVYSLNFKILKKGGEKCTRKERKIVSERRKINVCENPSISCQQQKNKIDPLFSNAAGLLRASL